jgi:hypothetical protein
VVLDNAQLFTWLVLVPGHAVWNLRDDPARDTSWFLKPYQNGEPRYFIEHIRAGVECAAANARALLMFSGGATDPAAGPISEALGYWLIAEWYGWWQQPAVRERAVLEERALDSLLNLRRGIERFREITGHHPEGITVCGWGFKRRRIAELHRAALGWTGAFEYVAVNDPQEDLATVMAREAQTCADFEADPFGDRPPLADKRAARRRLGSLPV